MSRFTEIHKSARKPHADWSNREIMQFHYHNPNGLITQKQKLDETIFNLVTDGKCKSGAIMAYGSGNDYAAERVRELSRLNRVGSIKRMVAVEMLTEAIAAAQKFIDEINAQTVAVDEAFAELVDQAWESGYQNYIDTIPNEGDRTASELRSFCQNAVWDTVGADGEEEAMKIIDARIKDMNLPEKLATVYTLHVTAGPAALEDGGYEDIKVVRECAEEYKSQTMGFLQPDVSYKQYPVDAIYIMDNSGSEDPIWSWYAAHEVVETPAVTPLQAAMLKKIAFDEFTPANGSMPSCAGDTETWADQVIETAQDKGVFTSLLNAKLVWHRGSGREGGVGLTEQGYQILVTLTKQNG